MGKRYFSNKIVKWYVDNKRSLPWRETTDPYKIWLSEVILQQTRVIQGLPYYQQFITAYPSVEKLADASEQEVLRLWQGLGYYSRARNLHKCARSVVDRFNGEFPSTSLELQQLPGVGEYTAAAIASFAYDEPVAVVDGNVFRILARIFGIENAINSPDGKKIFSKLANELLSKTNPALHNQAVMEFGALFCTPQNPNCVECPFQNTCIAYNQGLVRVLPVKLPKNKSRKRYFFYLVVEKDGTLLMKRRQDKDIWHGLFDFVLIEKTKPVRPEKLIGEVPHKNWFSRIVEISVSKKYKHILTHQTIDCYFIHVKTSGPFARPDQNHSFYSAPEIARLPKPALISRYLTDQNAH